jgi:hypothetical protein
MHAGLFMVDIHPEHARSVLESLAIGVVLVDKHGHVNWVNAYTSTLLKKPAEELLGRAIADLDLPYAPPEASSEPMEVRIDGAMLGITQRYEHAGGVGAVLLLLDRGHALVWFLSTLAGGVPGAVAASGVLARAAIQHRLDSEISRSRRYQNELTCIAVHCAGPDAEARAAGVARLLKEQLRWVDLLGPVERRHPAGGVARNRPRRRPGPARQARRAVDRAGQRRHRLRRHRLAQGRQCRTHGRAGDGLRARRLTPPGGTSPLSRSRG